MIYEVDHRQNFELGRRIMDYIFLYQKVHIFINQSLLSFSEIQKHIKHNTEWAGVNNQLCSSVHNCIEKSRTTFRH